MTYDKYMHDAQLAVIVEDDTSDTWFLDPNWKEILCSSGLGDIENVQASYKLEWDDVEDALLLEVKRRNKFCSKRNYLESWLYDILTTKVEPAIMQEETEYISQMLEYMKFKSEHPESGNAGADEKLKNVMPQGMDFSKK